MSLYHIVHDGMGYYVEAENLSNAVRVWTDEIRKEPDNLDFDAEPDSVTLLSVDPLIRVGSHREQELRASLSAREELLRNWETVASDNGSLQDPDEFRAHVANLREALKDERESCDMFRAIHTTRGGCSGNGRCPVCSDHDRRRSEEKRTPLTLSKGPEGSD